MNQQPCSFYSFLRAVQGNWRNALFIQCSQAACPCEVSQSCQGFLLTADAEGIPLLMPVSEICRLTGESVEATDCRGLLTGRLLKLPTVSILNGIPNPAGNVRFYRLYHSTCSRICTYF